MAVFVIGIIVKALSRLRDATFQFFTVDHRSRFLAESGALSERVDLDEFKQFPQSQAVHVHLKKSN